MMKAVILFFFLFISFAPSCFSQQKFECSEEIFLVLFPEELVKKSLNKHEIPAEKHDRIVNDLANADGEIKKRVEAKAANLNPNPLTDPSQREKASQIFSQSTFEVFYGVMNDNGVENNRTIQEMFREIEMARFERFKACREFFEQHMKEMQ